MSNPNIRNDDSRYWKILKYLDSTCMPHFSDERLHAIPVRNRPGIDEFEADAADFMRAIWLEPIIEYAEYAAEHECLFDVLGAKEGYHFAICGLKRGEVMGVVADRCDADLPEDCMARIASFLDAGQTGYMDVPLPPPLQKHCLTIAIEAWHPKDRWNLVRGMFGRYENIP